MNDLMEDNKDDDILPEEKDSEDTAKEQKEPSKKEIATGKPPEGEKDAAVTAKSVPSAESTQPSKETPEIAPEIRQKPKRKRRMSSKPEQPAQTAKKWEPKWVKVDGEKVLFVPSGFEIMTKDGWRPIMERADKIGK